ncbi:MAG: TonB-dependent receptor [Candidatus Poribacteria bacterium]|nr:TonB-dependent receptor [Candidatus Poribacteria bacterium]
MKFCLYSVLCIMLMIPFSVSAGTDNAKENTSPKTKRSIYQRIFPRTGDIEGTLYQRDIDVPLVEAEVRIVETDQSQKTGEDGAFRFIEIPIGTYTLSISHPTHNTSTEIPIKIRAGETLRRRFSINTEGTFVETLDGSEAATRLKPIFVEGQRLPPTMSRKEIRGSELTRIPGTGRDAFKGLTTLPSIGIPNDIFGILYIRGSAPGETLLYLDRTPLGYPFHFGSLISTINSDSIEDIRIYAGGYGAEFGLDSQSVIDIRSRERLEKRWAGVIDLNILSPSIFVETSIGNRGYASVAGRFNSLNLILGPFFDWTFPTWSDYQLKFAYALTEKHSLTLNGLGATDHFDFSNLESEETQELDDFSAYFKNGFEAEGIHLRSNFTDKLTSHLSLTRFHNFLNINLDSGSNQNDKSADEKFIYKVQVNAPTYTLREDVFYKLTPGLQFEPGFLLAFSPAKSSARTSSAENIDFESDAEPSWVQKFDEFHYIFRRAEGYLQARYDPLSFLSVAFGVRFDYLNLTEQLSIQPRGSLSLTLPTNTTLRFAYGRYEQSPSAYQVLKENGNRDLKSSLTQHYVMELEHELSPQTELKFAIYYKEMEKLVTRSVNVDALFDDSDAGVTTAYLNQGRGFVNGAEIFLRHRVSEKFFGWLSYAYTHAERRETPNDPYKPFLFDNTHIVSIVANYSPTTKTEIGAKWQYSCGTSAVPLSTLLMIQDPVTLGMHPVLSDVAGAIVPTEFQAYHRLDLRFSRKRTLWGLPVTAFTEIWNVYNSPNKTKFSFADKLVAEFKAAELEGDLDEFPFDLESPEYRSLVRFPFNISAGLVYEF